MAISHGNSMGVESSAKFLQPTRTCWTTGPNRHFTQRSGPGGEGDRWFIELPTQACPVYSTDSTDVQYLSQEPSRSHPNWHLLGTKSQGLLR